MKWKIKALPIPRSPDNGGWGVGGLNTPTAVFAENCIVSNGMRQLFYDIVTDPLGFPTQVSVSLYLLPVLRGQFDYNVHVTGFATTTTSIVRPWS